MTLDPYSGGGGEEADVEVKGVCAFVSRWHRGQGSGGTGSSKCGATSMEGSGGTMLEGPETKAAPPKPHIYCYCHSCVECGKCTKRALNSYVQMKSSTNLWHTLER